MKIKNILVIVSALIVVFLSQTKVLAHQYGEVEVTKDISINKKVWLPEEARDEDDNEWVDNIFASKYKFSPEQEVIFKVIVKNTGDKNLENIKFRDILPNYLKHISGDLEATFNLDVGQTREFDEIKTQVVASNDLPNNQGIYCVVNTAEVQLDDEVDRDTAQICIEKKEGEVLGFAALPEAGPEHSALILGGSLILALAGWVLIKKSY